MWSLASAAGWTAKATTYGKLALYVFIAIVLALVIGAGVGGYLGLGWEKGQQAKTENKTLRADLDAALTAVRSAQGAAAQVSRDATQASTAMHVISQGLTDDLDDNRTKASSIRADLEQAIARNPVGTAVRADDDFMRAWNAANRGDSAGAAGPGDAGPAGGRRPDGAVPAPAATGSGQQSGGAGKKPRRKRGDLSRLSSAAGAPDTSRTRARNLGSAAHRARTQGAGEVVRHA